MTFHLKDTPFEMHWMSQHSFQHALNSTWLFCQWPISLDVQRQAPCFRTPACLFAVLFDLLFLNQMRVNKAHFERFHLPKKPHDPCWLIRGFWNRGCKYYCHFLPSTKLRHVRTLRCTCHQLAKVTLHLCLCPHLAVKAKLHAFIQEGWGQIKVKQQMGWMHMWLKPNAIRASGEGRGIEYAWTQVDQTNLS